VNNRIALAVANFTDTADGDRYRCGLLAEFAALHAEREEWHRRLQQGVDAATQDRFGVPFCTEVADR
jgi:hypothetical protein